jgi:hypothetical protein
VQMPDVRLPRDIDHPWHVQINQLDMPLDRLIVEKDGVLSHGPTDEGKSFMYEAKHASQEVPRLALLFAREREGNLTKVHHQCSHDHEGAAVADNHLTCCLGVACRECPFLAAIDKVQTRRDYSVRPSLEVPVTDEERDVMKAWTCVSHILTRGGDPAGEGYVLTTDDRMYWDNLYHSLSSSQP